MWKYWSLEIGISVSLIVLISYIFDVYFSWAIPSVSEGGSLLKSTFSLCEKQIIFIQALYTVRRLDEIYLLLRLKCMMKATNLVMVAFLIFLI